MLLLCTEFLTKEIEFFFIVFCSVEALYVLVYAVCCLHLAFIQHIQQFVYLELLVCCKPTFGKSFSCHIYA